MAIYKVSAWGRTRYRVRYRDGKDPNPKTKTFDRHKDAEAFERSVRSAAEGRVEVRQQSNMTLGQFSLQYRELHAEVELAPATQANQRSVWNAHIEPRLAHHPLATLANEPHLLQRFKMDLIEAGVGDAGIAKTLSVLQAILSKAVEWNLIATNPARGVRKPRQKRKRVVTPLTPEAVEAIRANMHRPEDRLLVAVLAYAGLRPSEALALRGEDVGERTLSVTKAIRQGEEAETKTGKDRSVSLLRPLAEDLAGLQPGLIFSRADGRPWTDHDMHNWRKRRWQPACVAAGLASITIEGTGKSKRRSYYGPVPYDLRHSCASLLLQEGRTPVEVAQTMGHSPAILYSTYAHVIGETHGALPVPAEDQIQRARVKSVSQGVPFRP